jgi:hypothetical protein
MNSAVLIAILLLVGHPIAAQADPARAASRPMAPRPAIESLLRTIRDESRAMRLNTLADRMLPDCEITVIQPRPGQPPTIRMSRTEYLEITRAIFQSMREQQFTYALQESKPVIDLAPDGKSAVAVATSTETYAHPDGRAQRMVARSTLNLILKDGRWMIESVRILDQTPDASELPETARPAMTTRADPRSSRPA